MALVRSAEKSKYGDDEDLCELLTELLSLYSRQGLLLGNVPKARQVLESSSSSSTSKARGSAHHHPKRDNHANNTDASDDESLVLSALIRVLTKGNDSSSVVVCLAADVLTAVATHAQSECQTAIATAVQEILLKSSRSLLAGLGITIQTLSSKSSRDVRDTLALVSCLKATTTLISLLAQKVPRPTISTIRLGAWTALMDGDCKVRKASALLLSFLPLTGFENTPPADGWSASVLDAVVALGVIQTTMAPLRKLKTLSEGTQGIVTGWISHVTALDNEVDRIIQFQRYIQGISAYLVALLTREAYADSTRVTMMTAKLPIESILDLCESMILFPSAAETLFFSTKKRLRLEVIENGLLSSTAVVLEMANLVKYLGHDIMDTAINALGSALLPFARKVMKTSCASLLASSSAALQKVLDPTRSALQVNGKRKQWLHNSLTLRTRTIRTYGILIQTLGASGIAGSLSNQEAMGPNKANDVALAISCIGGSLLEQLLWSEETNDDWTTLSERENLCIAALDALSRLLTTGGGYLPLPGRSLIDSTTLRCLSYYIDVKSKSKVAACTSIKVEVLKLGTACLCTPWPDGAMSSIASDLRQVARTLVRDRDGNVATEAAACLRLCDTLSMPRVPALSIVMTREEGRETQSATSLLNNLKTAREEVIIAESIAAKPSPPLGESPKKAEMKAKRQKVQASVDTGIKATVPKAEQDPSATATVSKPSQSPKITLNEPVAATTGKKSAKVSTVASPRTEPTIADKAPASIESEKEASSLKRDTALGSLEGDTADDGDDSDFDFPDIVVDGGPDEEDQ